MVTGQVAETEERIDYQKLKMQERIAFYDEVILFEDELADNGAAIFSVKIVSHMTCKATPTLDDAVRTCRELCQVDSTSCQGSS